MLYSFLNSFLYKDNVNFYTKNIERDQCKIYDIHNVLYK